MEYIQVAITILCLMAIILLVIFAVCHSLNVLTWILAWVNSSKEEKIGLTRAKGLYNANGYLVHSDSDINLDPTGSFKRFDSVDRDFRITLATTSLSGGDWASNREDDIPPQPLRPAPTPPPIEEIQRRKSEEEGIRRQASISGAGIAQVEGEEAEVSAAMLKRAISCDSVCSDTSVGLGDLEEPNVTGYLCIGLEYDSEFFDLIVNVLEAKDLNCCTSTSCDPFNYYVRIFLLPEKETNAQTKVCRCTSNPSFKERFLFPLNPREQSQRSLCFHVYGTDMSSHTLIGEGEMRLSDVSLRQPITTWITLTDIGQVGTEFGEIMFSLSYLPTAERLTVVIVKARKLKFMDKVPGDPFVKVYLMQYGKKIHKKKTSTKKSETSPIYNEAMIFSVPAHTLSSIQLRVTVAQTVTTENTKAYPIGHVIVGSQASGRSLNHWNQMLTALRKPVAMWHPLRK